MKHLYLFLLFLFTICAWADDPGSVMTFEEKPIDPPSRSGQVEYSRTPTTEQFYVWVPKMYQNDGSWGLIVYMSPSNLTGLPPEWEKYLKANKLVLISPQGVGNGTRESRRLGMGVLAALEMETKYRLDTRRVYAAGLSGGARAAGYLGFVQNDIFHGTIQDCGADFYRKLTWKKGKDPEYGNVIRASAAEIQNTRMNCKFCFITGKGDFRYGEINDIYEQGYQPEGFMCKLIDVPGMGHTDCPGKYLQQALDYLK